MRAFVRAYWPTCFHSKKFVNGKTYDERELTVELRQSRNADKILFRYLSSLQYGTFPVEFVSSQFSPELTLGSLGSIHFGMVLF